ncbi:MAG: diguanylate cyclase [Fimbriimonadaceae bacterium]|nr:diguanylate cyclase [Fimbriimonadaceae bacterium]
MRTIAVLDGVRLVGALSLYDIPADVPELAKVSDYMRPTGFVVHSEMTIRRLAEEFHTQNLDSAPVVAGEKYLGIATATMLLKELLRTWDPITGLSWSDRLRDWGIDRLKESEELTIIFLDIDDFGLYNKKFGHIVGDRVLQVVAECLRELIDEDRDLLVRYGGDEFVLATVRYQVTAKEFAEAVRERVRVINISDAEEPISLSMGVSGGRRSKERESIHYAATLDNLINLASQDCQVDKLNRKKLKNGFVPEEPRFAVAAAPEEAIVETPEVGIRVDEVFADEANPAGLTTVLLSRGPDVASGVHSRAGGSVVESVVHATAKAIERLTPGIQLLIDDVHLSERENGTKYIAVTGRLVSDGGQMPISAIKPVDNNLSLSAAQTAILAIESSRV